MMLQNLHYVCGVKKRPPEGDTVVVLDAFDRIQLICRLFYQIPGKWDGVSVDGVKFLQHWPTLIQPINNTVSCTFFKTVCISYHHSYHFIASGNCKMCIWLSVFAIFNNICEELVVMLWLWFEPNMLSFLLIWCLSFLVRLC